jgi:hypothetical protein
MVNELGSLDAIFGLTAIPGDLALQVGGVSDETAK